MTKDTETDFATPEDALEIVTKMEQSHLVNSNNRAKINRQFNGGNPYTPKEEEDLQVEVNVNFLEGTKLAQDGNRQVNSALLHKGNFFTASCLGGKPEKRLDYGMSFTENIHQYLKRGKSGRKYAFQIADRNRDFTLHGKGIMIWTNDYDWMPKYNSPEDVLVPTDSNLDFSDSLGHLAVNSWLSPYQFKKLTQGEKTDRHWSKVFAAEVLKSLKNVKNYTPVLYDQPEKVESLWKQHALYMNSDILPKIKITTIYYQNPDTGKIHRKIILRENQCIGVEIKDKFLYDGNDEPFADNFDRVIHVLYGDGGVVAPLKFHSVRGLGMMLYGVIELMNRMRCQFTQHMFDQLMMLFRVQNPADRDRPKKIRYAQNERVLEEGWSIVPPQERHQINDGLIEQGFSMFRQLLSENSASFVQDIGKQSSGEAITAKEATIRQNSVNVMVSSMLEMAYQQENFKDEEIVRRFLNPNSQDPQVKEFRQKCIADGIPEKLLVPDNWRIDTERVLGGGDRALALEEANMLLSQIDRYDTPQQRMIQRNWTTVVTRSPDMGKSLVPEKPLEATDGRKAAEDVFGSLMWGIVVSKREGFEQVDYVTAMLQMMEAKIGQIMQTDGVGTPQDVIGLQAVAQDAGQHIQLLESDKSKKQIVKQFSDALGKLVNEVNGMAQRQQQAAESAGQQGQDLETQAKAEAIMKLTEAKMQAKDAEMQQKLQHREAQFEQKMKEKEAQFEARMKEAIDKSTFELQRQIATARSEMIASGLKTGQEVDAAKQKAAVTPKKKD